MSAKLVFQAVNLNPKKCGISTTEKLTLICLASRVSNDGLCFPSYNAIASDVGCSPRTAHRAVANLKRLGFLTIANTYTDTGFQTSNRYRLKLGADTITTGGDVVANETIYNNSLVGNSDTPKNKSLVAHKSLGALAG
jgi:hypothetical protein